MGTNSHWQVSRKVLMERRRQALEDAGLMEKGAGKAESEKYLVRINY